MLNLARLAALFIALFSSTQLAQAFVRINIDLASQRMEVDSSSGAHHSWPISSARSGYVTPNGVYSPTRLHVMHRSKKYHNSPMPHSIFFHGGYAIHGTYQTAALGQPASHGCIRIAPANAAKLFSLVRAEGATISIIGSPPPSRAFADRDGGHRRHHAAAHQNHRRHPTALSYAPVRQQNDIERIFGAILAH